MHRTVLAAATGLAMLGAAVLLPGPADAMTLPAPAGVAAAAQGTSLAQDVAYVCRRVWRCGPYGCGWRRVCWWTGPRYYRPYPYYRYRYWRHHHW
jgi:hypothetical protein